jgi:hypothetical protein
VLSACVRELAATFFLASPRARWSTTQLRKSSCAARWDYHFVFAAHRSFRSMLGKRTVAFPGGIVKMAALVKCPVTVVLSLGF